LGERGKGEQKKVSNRKVIRQFFSVPKGVAKALLQKTARAKENKKTNSAQSHLVLPGRSWPPTPPGEKKEIKKRGMAIRQRRKGRPL